MNTKGLFLAVALFLGMAVTGCSKEQSELDLGSITGSATLKGQVTYNSGYYSYDAVSNTSNYEVVATGITVYVDVAYNQYDTSASGVKRYTVTTDAEGNYSLAIPCSVSMSSVSATVKVPAFTATYSQMVNTELKSDSAAIYTTTTTTSIPSGDQTVCDIYIFTPTYDFQ